MIVVRGLSKVRGGNNLLLGVTLDVPRGGRLALLGPSGSGKTTLLRLIAGLEEPSGGTVLLEGREVSRPGRVVIEPHARHLAMAFQRPALWPHMTVAANVSFGLRASGAARAAARTDELLNAFSIVHLARRFPHQISGGEAQRVSIARALAPGLPILLLDEPLSHLDSEMALQSRRVIEREVLERGLTLVSASHDSDGAREFCESVLVLKNGAVAFHGVWEYYRWVEGARSAPPPPSGSRA